MSYPYSIISPGSLKKFLKTMGIDKHCPEYLSLVFEVSSCSYQNTFNLAIECFLNIFSRPGQNQGLLYKHLCASFIQWWFVKISLQRRPTQMVEDGAFNHKIDNVTMFSRPGQSQGLHYKHLCHSFIHSFIDSVSQPFPPTALQCRHTQTVRDRASSYKIDYVIVIELSKSRRASQSHQWFKSYSHFTEGVDFAYWWSFSGGGSTLQQILNPEGHPNRITGPKVRAILLNGWILPIRGASAVKGLRLQRMQECCFL